MGPIDRFRKDVCKIAGDALEKPYNEIASLLEKPPEGVGADLALPCFFLSKERRADPKAIASEAVLKITENGKLKGQISRVEADGPYVNFYADWDALAPFLINEIKSLGGDFGKGIEKKKILIEHTSANPDGPLHLGHFRNTVIGDSIARILKFSGNSTKTISLVNDTGRQIAIAVREYLDNNSKSAKKPNKKSDWWILDLYLKGNQRLEKDKSIKEDVSKIIRKFEGGNKTLRKTFHKLTEECVNGHKQTMKNLGISIDNFDRESDLLFDGTVKTVLNRAKLLPCAKTEKKRLFMDLSKQGIEREFTLTREDGTTIYPARDLAFHYRKFSKAERNINIIGTDQKFYFKQLVIVLEKLFKKETKNYDIVFYEFLKLPEGSMSTRQGKFVAVDDAVDDALKMAKKVVTEKMPHYSNKEKESVAKAVGIGALKYAMIKVSPEKTYSFNMKDALSFDGNNAPYLQYTHARACSILRKATKKEILSKQAAGDYILTDPEIALLSHIGAFPAVVEKAAKDLRPHYIANYSYTLATKFNEFYEKCPVLKPGKAQRGTEAEDEFESIRKVRLGLVDAARTVLENSLNLLGINAPDKM